MAETSAEIATIAAKLMKHADADVRSVAATALRQHELIETLPVIVTKLKQGEPYFIFRAQDMLTPVCISLWLLMSRTLGAPLSKLRSAEQALDKIRDWQKQHGSKVAD